MADPKFRTKWAKGPDFAEIAEAIGVPTDHVVGAFVPPDHPNAVLVMYSPEMPPDPTTLSQDEIEQHEVLKAVYERDDDGILHLAHGPEVEPNFWRGLRESLEAEE